MAEVNLFLELAQAAALTSNIMRRRKMMMMMMVMMMMMTMMITQMSHRISPRRSRSGPGTGPAATAISNMGG